MSIRKKLALWLCPELEQSMELRLSMAELKGSVHAIAAATAENARHAKAAAEKLDKVNAKADAAPSLEQIYIDWRRDIRLASEKLAKERADTAWRTEVLDRLRSIDNTLTAVTEGGNAMRVIAL
ncbi:hypothetical protein GCM10027082_24440 [Comamonas humi]